MSHIIILGQSRQVIDQLKNLSQQLDEGQPYSPAERQEQADALVARAEDAADILQPNLEEWAQLGSDMESFLGL